MNESRHWKPGQVSTVVVPVLLLALMFTPNSAMAWQEQERTWTDSSGEHRIKATLVETDGTEVVLRKGDGKMVTLKIARLSKTDQTWLDNRENGNSGKATSSKPSVGKRGVVEIDSRESRQLKSRRVEPWSLPPDASTVEPLVYSSDGISMGVTGNLMDTQAALSRQRELAVFSYQQGFFHLVQRRQPGHRNFGRVNIA